MSLPIESRMRVNRGQESVIGGYTRGTKTFVALIFGCCEGDRLIYVARTRNGFTPAARAGAGPFCRLCCLEHIEETLAIPTVKRRFGTK
jgi:hypothetical protein